MQLALEEPVSLQMMIATEKFTIAPKTPKAFGSIQRTNLVYIS